MDTRLGTFYIKTYSIARPNAQTLSRIKDIINSESKIPIEKALIIAKNPFDESEVQNLAISFIDEGELEHKLFIANGGERVCLNLKKHTIELTSF